MFSRRHPYLFFLLIFSSIVAVAFIGTATLFLLAARGSGYLGLDKDGGEKVGVVELTGVISDAKDTIRQLKQFRKEDAIKAIVIRIDSPGGAVGPSQEIYQEIRKIVKTKKMVASMGAVAASGGYYVASATNGIVANPGSITGSIGVVMGFTNFQHLLEKIGLTPIIVKSGEYKDIGSPVREMTDEEKKFLQSFVDNIHRQFVADVSAGRNMDQARVEALADGRIFSGQDAQSLGLVDRLGNLEDAIEWAGRMGGIEGEITAVYGQQQKFSLLKYLLEMAIQLLAQGASTPRLQADYLYLHPG